MRKIRIAVALLCAVALTFACSCGSADYAMKYKDAVMSRAEYSYWFSTIKASVLSGLNSGGDTEEFWNTENSDGVPYYETITESVNAQIAGILISCELFDEYGLELDAAAYEQIDADIAEKIDYLGGLSEMNRELGEFGLNADVLREVYVNGFKVNAVREYLYGEKGAQAPDDAAKNDFFTANYRAVKMIVIYTGAEPEKDDDGNYLYDANGNVRTRALTGEEAALKAQLVDAVKDALDSGADVDQCVAEFSEADYSAYPNGFFVSRGDASRYGSDVVSAVWNTDEGGVATVSDDNMTFILCRVGLPSYSSLSQSDLAQLSGFDDALINDLINRKVAELSADVTVNEDVTSEFDIRTAHRNSYY